GQFCTKPGMVFLPQGEGCAAFAQKLQLLAAATKPHPLLTRSILSSYRSAIEERKRVASVKLMVESTASGDDAAGFVPGVELFETDAATFLASDLGDEIFGPTTLLVRHSKRDQVLEIARMMEGHLTATIHGTEQDLRDFSDLIVILAGKV